MTKTLMKAGNSETLVITKEMKRHLGIVDGQIEVEYHAGCIVLRKPVSRQSFDEALDATFAQYDDAMRKLAE